MTLLTEFDPSYSMSAVLSVYGSSLPQFSYECETPNVSSLGGLEPPSSRLTAERASLLRHRDMLIALINHFISGSIQPNLTKIFQVSIRNILKQQGARNIA